MRKVMLTMFQTLGDVIMSTTLVHELKKIYPDSEIYFYTNREYAELLGNNPDIFKVVECDNRDLNFTFMEMSDKGYDLVYSPYQVRRECNAWHQFESTRHQHLVDFYWKRMGMHSLITEREAYLYPSENDEKEALEHISFDVPRVALHSTTGVATKDWMYFNELAEELRKAGIGCVQVGSRTDKKIEGAIDLRGKMKLLELAAFLKNCAAFVGLDSGLSYMADAVKTPTIVIQGSTNPVTSGPYSSRVQHLFAKETGYADCQEIRCHTNCRHEVNCITKISVQSVLDEIGKSITNWNLPIPAGV